MYGVVALLIEPARLRPQRSMSERRMDDRQPSGLPRPAKLGLES
jgi:hypothetical protein